MKNYWLIAIRLTLITAILYGVVYPLTITGIALLVAPNKGMGEVITRHGSVIGFALIGQKFDEPKYFQSRPSAVAYNAASTGGSNKAPANPEYLSSVALRIEKFLQQNPDVKKEDLPVDLVTASGSGIDPHISVQAALIQIHRIAKVRGIAESQLRSIVEQNTSASIFGIMGTKTVHVLNLNLALDNI